MGPKRHRMLGAAAGIAAALGACGIALPAPLAAQKTASSASSWVANDDDFLIFQLVIKNYKMTQDVRGYQTDRGICLDLADVIQSLDLPVRIDKKSRRATGWLFAEDQRFTLDRDANTVQNMNIGSAPLGSDIHDTPEGWCVESDALSRWFGITFNPDRYNAIIRLESKRDLPFMQAIERRSRAARLKPRKTAFDLSNFPHADMEYKAWRSPSTDVVMHSGYRSGGLAGSDLNARAEVYVVGEALGASYFARLATDDELNPTTLRVRAYRQDQDAGLLGPLKATEVAIGDVETDAGQLTGQSAVGRGAFITNKPLGQAGRFSTTTLRGVLPAGWDAELYRNDQLIAFQDSTGDGRYEFVDIELFFGRNDLEVVLYGPQGQIKRERFQFPIGSNNIEPGKTYYWAGVVQDNHDLIELNAANSPGPQKWRWGVGVERGLDERTSIALGAQSLWYAGKRRSYAESSLTRSFGAMLLELGTAYEWGAGVATQANAIGRLGGINIGANLLWTFGNFASEFVDSNIDSRMGLQFDTSLRLGKMVVPVQAAVSHARLRDGGTRTDLEAQVSLTRGPLALSAQINHLKQSASSSGPGSKSTKLSLLANARIKGLRLRGNASFELAGPSKGFELARISATKDLDERSQINGEVEYLPQARDTRFSLGYSRRFKSFALRADASAATSGEVGLRLSLNFSLGPDPVSGGIRMTETKLARFGQAAVTVFRDDNGDGRFNEGEEVMRDVGVEAGFRVTDAVTGENGRTMLDDLRPFKPVLVGVDESTLGDPFLAPAVKGVVVVPRPGIAAQVELPIAASGEIEGVLLGLNGVKQPGVKLELVDRSGKLVAATLSEFDGFFLFERVPYGEYRLRIAANDAKKLAAQADLKSGIRLGKAKDIARLGVVRLHAGTHIASLDSNGALGGAPGGDAGAMGP